MTAPRYNLSGPKALALCLFACGIVLVSAAPATASCGDYLHKRGPKNAKTNVAGDRPDSHKRDCNGPGCRGHRPDSLPVPAPVTSSGGSDELLSDAPKATEATGRNRYAKWRSDLVLSVGYPESVDRPPRG